MTGQRTEKPRVTEGLALGEMDADSANRIDVHLRRAQDADDGEQKDFHLRHARQLLEACRET